MTTDTFQRLLDSLRNEAVAIGEVIHNFPDAILLIDREDRIRYWNRGAEELFGYTSDEAIGKYYDLLLPGDQRTTDEFERIVAQTQAQQVVRNHITRRKTRGGNNLWVSLTRTLLHDETGTVIGACAMLRDITEQRRTEEELQRSSSLAMIGELASRVAHEIKNPLAGIYGALQVLRCADTTSLADREVLDNMAAEIRRLDAIVRDLLRFARPTPINRQPTSVAQLVDTVLNLLANEPQLARVEIERVGDEALSLALDPALVEQVLINLIQNSALALGEERRTISIHWEDRGPWATVAVRDTGSGMSQEVLDRIFAPFFTTRRGGTGLGLAICRKNVEAHGGRLEVESEEGQGSTFTIHLPHPADEGHPPPTS